MAKDNPILERYKGIDVRRTNIIKLRFGVVQFKKIIDEVEETGLSVHKVLAYSGKPCDKCKGVDVVYYDSNDTPHNIKRGILAIPEGNGLNIFQQAKIRNEKSNRTSKEDKY